MDELRSKPAKTTALKPTKAGRKPKFEKNSKMQIVHGVLPCVGYGSVAVFYLWELIHHMYPNLHFWIHLQLW
jgi:hypothetical protein